MLERAWALCYVRTQNAIVLHIKPIIENIYMLFIDTEMENAYN